MSTPALTRPDVTGPDVTRPDVTRPAVIVPAHNAAHTIDACLESITTDGDFDVVVVANGCTDATAARARAHRVHVVEVPDANKAAALNTGDRHAHGRPRLYVDADVTFEPGGVRALLDALDRGAVAAAPRVRIVDDDSSRTVRSYLAIWRRLGVVETGLCGSGVYALSGPGRTRFGAFPDLIADDLFVDQRFSLDERARVSPGVSYRAPRTTRALLRRKTRVFVGNLQLRRTGPACHPDRRPGRGWVGVVVAEPRLVRHVPAYVAITVTAKAAARLALVTGRTTWGVR